MDIGHGIISTAILYLALIQVGLLSVSGERMYAKSKFSKEKGGSVN